MRRGFKSWAENQALAQRQALNLPAVAPLPAALLAPLLGVIVLTPERVPGLPAPLRHQLLQRDPAAWSAATLEGNGQRLIIHNPQHAPTRRESDLMHELGHLLCGHQPRRIVQITGIPFPLREFDGGQEDEATWLGGCLQLPRAALLWALRQGLDEQQISCHFTASVALIRYRRNMTGIDRQLRRGRQQ